MEGMYEHSSTRQWLEFSENKTCLPSVGDNWKYKARITLIGHEPVSLLPSMGAILSLKFTLTFQHKVYRSSPLYACLY
jgi:hypothetical protein